MISPVQRMQILWVVKLTVVLKNYLDTLDLFQPQKSFGTVILKKRFREKLSFCHISVIHVFLFCIFLCNTRGVVHAMYSK